MMRPASAPAGWRQQAERLQHEGYAFYFVWKHPGTRWYSRLLAICIAGYLFSPIQLIPNFIPVIGFLDDLLILCLGVKLLHRITPPDVLADCHELAKATAMRQREKRRSVPALFCSSTIIVLWLLGAVTASALIVKYIPR